MNGQIRIWVDHKFGVANRWIFVWHCLDLCVCVCVCVGGGGGGAHEYSFLSTSSRFIQTPLFSLSLSGQHGLPHQSSKI